MTDPTFTDRCPYSPSGWAVWLGTRGGSPVCTCQPITVPDVGEMVQAAELTPEDIAWARGEIERMKQSG